MSTELAVINQTKGTISIRENGIQLTTMDELWRFSTAVELSGMAPAGLKEKEKIFVAIQMGLEVGLTPITALQNTAIINGKAGLYGDIILGLILGKGLLERFDETQTNDELDPIFRRMCLLPEGKEQDELRIRLSEKQCTLNPSADDFGYSCFVKRIGKPPGFGRFTVKLAKKANLWGKSGPWTQYPERQLMFRTRQFLLRDKFPDVLKGVKSVEELRDYPEDIQTPERPAPSLSAPEKAVTKVEVAEPSKVPDIREKFKAELASKGIPESFAWEYIKKLRPDVAGLRDLDAGLKMIHGKTIGSLILPKVPEMLEQYLASRKDQPEIKDETSPMMLERDFPVDPNDPLGAYSETAKKFMRLLDVEGIKLGDCMSYAIDSGLVSDAATDIRECSDTDLESMFQNWKTLKPQIQLFIA